MPVAQDVFEIVPIEIADQADQSAKAELAPCYGCSSAGSCCLYCHG